MLSPFDTVIDPPLRLTARFQYFAADTGLRFLSFYLPAFLTEGDSH
jgi:hypothetical protein